MQIHHYPRRIGDYAARTVHLSEMEDLAHRRLEDLYFMLSKPLPRDVDAVARLIRMRDYISIVQAVLKEFFEETDDGWRHRAYDADLASILDKHKKASAAGKASGNARRASDQRAFNGRSTDVQPPTPTPITEAIASDAAAAPAFETGGPPTPPPPPPPPPSADLLPDASRAALWRESLDVLQAGGCPSEGMARSFIGKLVKDFGAEVVREAVTAAITAQPADAREYLRATCQRLRGQRRYPVTVTSSDAERTQAMLRQQALRDRDQAGPDPEVRARLQAQAARARRAKTAPPSAVEVPEGGREPA